MNPVNSRKWNSQFRQLVNWNKYQLAIFDWVEKGSGNALITGVAGCGKSTTILGALACIKGKTQVVAFNTHIANHLKNDTRITKSRVTVSTAHSLGLSLLQSFIPCRIHVDNSKLRSLLKETFILKSLSPILIKQEIATHSGLSQPKSINKRYVTLLQSLIEIVRKIQINLLPQDYSSILLVLIKYNIPLPVSISFFYTYLLDIPLLLLKSSELLAETRGIIDYNDMLWLPHLWDIKNVPAKDFIIVDEVQDVNKAMISLYKKWTDTGTRALLLGDPNQSIFGFAGSDTFSWQLLQDTFQPHELPLSYCYRCPTLHIQLAQTIVPYIEAPPTSPKGLIQVRSKNHLLDEVQQGDLVLSRTTYPLIETCIKLMSKGVRAYIKGLDLRDSLISLIKEIAVDEIYISSLDVQTKEQEIKENDKTIDWVLLDKLSTIRYCLYQLASNPPRIIRISKLVEHINQLFDPKEGGVILSSIHRAKGDEANHVWLLNCDNLPFLFKAKQSWEIQQEWNLVYVALTRATSTLSLVPSTSELLSSPLGGLIFTTMPLPVSPMSFPTSFFESNWVSLIDKAPVSNRWSYLPSDSTHHSLPYKPNSHKAFCIVTSLSPFKFKFSSQKYPICWTHPDFNLYFSLLSLSLNQDLLGLEDFILLVPSPLDTLLLKTNHMYREDPPIDIATINLPIGSPYSNHVLIVKKDFSTQSKIVNQPIVLKVCEEFNIYDLLNPL